MKKILAMLMCAMLAFAAAARPGHGGALMPHGPRGGFHHPVGNYHHWSPSVHHSRPHHIHIGPSLVAGGAIAGGIVLGSAIASAITPAPVAATVVTPAPVVATPAPIYTSAEVIGVNPVPAVYQTTRVWCPGHYETRYLGNGLTTQVWMPGYWR